MCKHAKGQYPYESQLHDVKSHLKYNFMPDMFIYLIILLKSYLKMFEVC